MPILIDPAESLTESLRKLSDQELILYQASAVLSGPKNLNCRVSRYLSLLVS